MDQPRLSIFARWPEPGQVKTRLIPSLGAEGAAVVYARLLAHTVAVATASGIPFELRATGAREEAFRELLGFEVAVVPQGDGDLGERLSRVPPPAIVIGSDCPGLTPEVLWAAHDALATEPMVIGPASDGGYYLIGFTEDAEFAFADIAWSTAQVFEETAGRFAARGYRLAVLPELDDIDTPEDLENWPEFQP
jgi:rSAM/selenodomain-associated transferase 1